MPQPAEPQPSLPPQEASIYQRIACDEAAPVPADEGWADAPPPSAPRTPPRKGRGTTEQPAVRYAGWQRVPLDDGWGSPDEAGESGGLSGSPERDPGVPGPDPQAGTAPRRGAAAGLKALRLSGDAGIRAPGAAPGDGHAPHPSVGRDAGADAGPPDFALLAAPAPFADPPALAPSPAAAPLPLPADTDPGLPRDDPEPPPPGPRTRIHPVRIRRILSSNNSPDVPFDRSINPYRGCEHGCIYCYARPGHAWLDRSPGLDFETEIEAKVEAARHLREELARPGHRPTPINLGAVTDPYQPAERRWALSRALLGVLLDTRHPFTIITKGAGIVRDLDLLAQAAARRLVAVSLTVTTLDTALARILEPRASSPAARLQAVRRLSAAGVPVAVNAAPLIPFVNEPEIERIAEAAAAHGASALHYTVLRLPGEVAPLFRQWLQDHLPDRAARVMARIQDMRGGRDHDSDFRHRMHGQGPWAELIAERVAQAAARHGLARHLPELDSQAFRPPPPSRRMAPRPPAGQASLF